MWLLWPFLHGRLKTDDFQLQDVQIKRKHLPSAYSVRKQTADAGAHGHDDQAKIPLVYVEELSKKQTTLVCNLLKLQINY